MHYLTAGCRQFSLLHDTPFIRTREYSILFSQGSACLSRKIFNSRWGGHVIGSVSVFCRTKVRARSKSRQGKSGPELNYLTGSGLELPCIFPDLRCLTTLQGCQDYLI